MSSFARFILFTLGLFLMLLSLTSLFDNRLRGDQVFTSPTPFTYLVTETPTPLVKPATATVGAAFTQIAQSTQAIIIASTAQAQLDILVPTATATIRVVTVTPLLPPNTLLLGKHIVQPGEYLYCIGRAYGVAPEAIAGFNAFAFDAPLIVGQILRIPDSPWVNIPAGRICQAQFLSPYSPKPLPTPTYVAGIIPNIHNNFGKNLRLINFINSNKAINNVSLQAIELTATPTDDSIVEVRTVYIDWPPKMKLGESDIVIMTFNPGTGQINVSAPTPPITSPTGPASTPNPKRNRDSSNPINILDMFPDYRIFAVARLDAAGFQYSPKDDIPKEINKGGNLEWQWSIKPQEARNQEIIISLRLHYEPRTEINPLPKVQPDQDVWSKPYQVKVEKTLYEILFGSQAPILPAVVGLVLSLFAVGKDASASLAWVGQKIKPTRKSSDVK